MKNFMHAAFKEALKAFENDEVPVGAVLVANGKILSAAHNQNRALNDATAHAEILAIRAACEIKGSSRLDDCDLYITLEPCAMCAAAISLARIRNVYYACGDEKFGAVENGVRFFASKSCFHRPDVYSGIGEKEARELMRRFFANRRGAACHAPDND